MSTEIFRKYIDLLNEDVSQNDIDNVLVPALNELERVLNNPKYAGKIRSYFGEDAHLLEVDIYIPPESSPRTAAQQAAMDAQRLGTAPVTRPSPPPPPPAPPSAISKAASKVLDVGTKVIKNPYARVAAGLAATVYAIVKQWDFISSLNFDDLDTLDQNTVKKNLNAIEPFVTLEVLPTLPEDIQARVKTVLSLLANLGRGVPAALGAPGGNVSRQRLAKTLPGAGGSGELDKPPAPPEPVKTGLDTLSPAWNNQGTAAPDDVNKFLDAIKNAEKYVSGIRESHKQSPSLDMSQLSEAEKMAMFRDRLNEDAGVLSMLWDALGLAGSVGVGAGGISWARSALQELWSKFLADHPDMAGKNFSEQLPKFREWVKITADAAAKSKVRGLQAGLTAGAVTLLVWLAQSGLSAYGLYKAGSMANDLVQNMGQDTKATQDVYDMYLQMPADAYNAMEQKDKDRLQKILLAHCVKFPKDPHCSTIISQICSVHPDWAGCKL
jgi:hypothetical protein